MSDGDDERTCEWEDCEHEAPEECGWQTDDGWYCLVHYDYYEELNGVK